MGQMPFLMPTAVMHTGFYHVASTTTPEGERVSLHLTPVPMCRYIRNNVKVLDFVVFLCVIFSFLCVYVVYSAFAYSVNKKKINTNIFMSILVATTTELTSHV